MTIAQSDKINGEHKRRLARERQRRCRERKKLKQLNGQQNFDGTTWVDSGQASSSHSVTKSKRDSYANVIPVTQKLSRSHDCVKQKQRDTVMAKVHERLRETQSEIGYNVWLADMELLSLNDAEAVIKSSDFKVPLLQNRFLAAITKAFEAVVSHAVTVTVLSETEADIARCAVTPKQRDCHENVTHDTPLSRLDEKNRIERKHTTCAGAREVDSVSKVVFGWMGSEPTKTERSSVKRWLLWGFDADVMYLAWQLAEKYADRSPIGYMNVVLESWHKLNIHDYDSALALFESRYGQQICQIG